MAVSRDDVRAIASLARLHVDADKLDTVARDLSSILSHMEVLQQVDTSAVGDDVGNAAMALRDDVVSPQPLALSNESFAPLMRDGFFLVPRLATHENQGSETTG